MEVTVFCINKGTESQFFGLKDLEENEIVYYAPNNWKTIRGAKNWAIKHGYKFVDPT